ncbi:Uncharacterised protein [Oligella urethralis]|nr:Uncharacterised protein [Oligella urethralis]
MMSRLKNELSELLGTDVHAYYNIDQAIVWDTVNKDIRLVLASMP